MLKADAYYATSVHIERAISAKFSGRVIPPVGAKWPCSVYTAFDRSGSLTIRIERAQKATPVVKPKEVALPVDPATESVGFAENVFGAYTSYDAPSKAASDVASDVAKELDPMTDEEGEFLAAITDGVNVLWRKNGVSRNTWKIDATSFRLEDTKKIWGGAGGQTKEYSW